MNSLLQYFQEAATDSSKRDSVQIVDGYWQLKIKGQDKWLKTCAMACVPADAEQTIDGDTLTVRWLSYADLIFGADGLIARAKANYEVRPGQLHMARLVQRSIEMGEPFVCEAGTGIGKSYAYAAICMAMGKRCIISTSNKALQMQLYNTDIPFLQNLFPGKTVVLAQGKSNYVCIDRYKNKSGDRRFNQWLSSTDTGNIEELTFDLHDVSKYTVDEDCPGQHCEYYKECFYYEQKRLRKDADIIICNHSLLALNHLYQNAGILPDTAVVVVDEAHQLPGYVRNSIGSEYYAGKVRRALQNAYEHHDIDIGTAENLLLYFDSELQRYALAFTEKEKQIHIPNDMGFVSGIELANEVESIAKQVEYVAIDAVIKATGKRIEDKKTAYAIVLDNDELVPDRKAIHKALKRSDAISNLALDLSYISAKTIEGHVRWVEPEVPKVINMPFDVSSFIRSMVEDTPAVYILTSATLATPTLDGFKRECGIDHGFELIAQSSFDYANNALLYIPNGTTPPPNQPAYLEYLIDEIRGIVTASGGGAFLLFTSFHNMNKCKDALRSTFATRFPVYVQGELPKLEIARRFKADGNAVLFATKSFWEGVDIPGDALRCVIIDKMPFAAPSPLSKAREVTTKNPFADIALPEMIIDLKQGVGRLVRRATDKGVIAILDSRIRSKPYGRNIVLPSLPPAKLTSSTAMITEFFQVPAPVPDVVPITIHSVEDFTLVF